MSLPDKHLSAPGGLSERTPDWHHARFQEFVRAKLDIGEPSPHLSLACRWAGELESLEDRAWLLGCYSATYTIPSTQVITDEWKFYDVTEDPLAFSEWVHRHMGGLSTRIERRCVRQPAQLVKCLESYLVWMENEFPALWTHPLNGTPEFYPIVWKSLEGVYSFGRYIIIRLIEGLRRCCEIDARIPGIQAAGGWSPVRALAIFFPQYAGLLAEDSPAAVRMAESLAAEMIDRHGSALRGLTPYVMSIQLCEYRQAVENRSQYPGYSIDAEQKHLETAVRYWGARFDKERFYAARRCIHPTQALGEQQGWRGNRPLCGATLRDHGYVWSDLRFDYHATEAEGCWDSPIPHGAGTDLFSG